MVVHAAAGAGFRSVGLDNVTLRTSAIETVAQMLRDHRLRCSDLGVLPIGRKNASDVAEALAAVAHATGATTCIAAFFAPVEEAAAVRALDECATVLGDVGVRIALEFASYGGLTRLIDAVALCDKVGWDRCGLLIDTWHFFRAGADWPTLQGLGGDQIALVHLNDGLPDVGDDPVRAGRYERLPAGRGTFPLSEFVATLEAAGYAGTLSAEVLSDAIRLRPPAEGASLLWQDFELTLG